MQPDHSQTDTSGRVSDAPSGSWVYNVLPRALWPYAQLARWDRPIGWQLLMWPCFWSAALAAHQSLSDGNFSFYRLVWHLVLFFIGAVAMRGAGCTWNDLVDHEIDNKVARTRSRPLPSGRVSRMQAKVFLVTQALVGFVVLIQFNWFSILLGIASLAVVAAYPFAKRVTDWPQFVLGLAFSWGGLMGWATETGTLSFVALFLYAGSIAWTIGYDTIYAHQDAEDDALVGVRSTALLFGDATRIWLGLFYGAAMVLIGLSFIATGVSFPAWLGLLGALGMLVWQLVVLDIRDAASCLRLFRANSTVGLVIFAGLILSLPLS